MTDTFDRACELSGKLGGISYEAKVAVNDIAHLREWIGKGTSRKTNAMRSLCDSLERRLNNIVKDSK